MPNLTDQHFDTGFNAPADTGVAVTPNDGADLTTPARALFVGTGGNVAVIFAADQSSGGAGTAVTLKNVASGTILPIRVRRVMSTNTSATDIVALS